MKNLIFLVFSFLFCLAFFGCGNPDLGQVAGTVTYDGQPLEEATIAFVPESPDGIFAVATTDKQGRYVLSAPIKKGMTRGALSGNYRVTISKKDVVPDPDEVLFSKGEISYDELQTRMAKKKRDESKTFDLVPTRYGNIETSELHAEVKAKTQNVFNFDLTK